MENERQNQKDDEISLLDLFTVLLRYRKMIAGITLFSVLLAVAGYIFYPVFKNRNITENTEYQTKALFTIKQKARKYVTQNLENVINNAENTYESLKDAGLEEFMGVSLSDETVKLRALYLINNDLIKKPASGKDDSQDKRKIRIAAPNTRDIVTVEISFSDSNFEVVSKFIPALFVRSNNLIRAYINSDITNVIEYFERMFNLDVIPQSSQTITDSDFGEYIFLKNVVDKNESILIQIGDTVITETEVSMLSLRKDFLVKSVFIIVGGFFISVFFAFALNVIRNIKNDEEAMNKIRDALGTSSNK